MTLRFYTDPLTYIVGDERPRAVESLARYLTDFSGRAFEAIADTENPARITEKDLVAVTMLGVSIPGRAALWILDGTGEAADIPSLLSSIPWCQDALWKAEDHLRHDGPAWQLYRLLTSCRGIGRTKATKLMAAKRPHLVPVYDTTIGRALGIGDNDDDWSAWRSVMAGTNARDEIAKVRNDVPKAADLSLLRTIDIIIWIRHRGWMATGEDHFPPFGSE